MKKLSTVLLGLVLIGLLSSCRDLLTDVATKDAIDKSGQINNDEVWTESGSSIDIHIVSDLIINAHVEVDEGISILVEDGAAIIVEEGGVFEVKGRSGSEVKIFGSGSDDEPTWRGIYFNSDDIGNELSYVEIKGAGSDIITIGDKKNSAAAVEVFGSLWMNNCLITSSSEIGVLVNGNSSRTSDLRNFDEIEVRGCGTYPMWIDFESLTNFTDDLQTCQFEENGINMLGMFGNPSGISGEHKWRGAPIPYYISEGLTIQGGLEILDGAELVMQSSAEIYVNSTNNSYYLNLNGYTSSPITIRGENTGVNSWPGIWFNTNNVNNKISFTQIIGGGVPTASATSPSIFVSGLTSPGSTLEINNLEILDSECGISKGPTATVSGMSSVSLGAGVALSCD